MPDYIAVRSPFGEAGTARDKVGDISGNPYVAVRFSHPKIDRSSIFANLGPAYGGEDCDYALLWKPLVIEGNAFKLPVWLLGQPGFSRSYLPRGGQAS